MNVHPHVYRYMRKPYFKKVLGRQKRRAMTYVHIYVNVCTYICSQISKKKKNVLNVFEEAEKEGCYVICINT